MTERRRVVVDTNVLISRLLVSRSTAARAFDKAVAVADVLTSDACLEEVADVLSRPQFDRYVSIEDRQEFLRRFIQIAQPVSVHSVIESCRDPRDHKFLELAADGGADCIVTGDRDLLMLNPFHGIGIMTPADFLADVEAGDAG